MQIFPQDQVFWYLNRGKTEPLRVDRKFDVVIVGGGIAGLTAAQSFSKKGLKVALLEQYYCGAGASGKSSGFITPDAELSLTDFTQLYGKEKAKEIWQLITGGCELIKNNIKEFAIECDYRVEDTLVVANSRSTIKEIQEEHDTRLSEGFESTYYNAASLPKIIGTDAYFAGVKYGDTFGINGFKYCQAMKQILEKQGVEIFEETPVLELQNHGVKTQHASVEADHIVVCADRFLPDLGKLKQEVYHAQTFLMVSQVLTQKEIKQIFPQDNLMVWDTDLIYTYFRMTADNRLLLGGGSVLNTYAKHEIYHSEFIYKKLTKYFKDKFPQLEIQFEQFWPGLIGLSKDIVPIAGFDRELKNVYYIAAAAGLPIAAALGNYSAERMLNKNRSFDEVFDPYRKYPVQGVLQSILGTKISFALSNAWAKFI